MTKNERLILRLGVVIGFAAGFVEALLLKWLL